MAKTAKPHNERLEKLIRLVDKEQEAGRLTEEQVKAIAKKSLKPLEESENSLAYFMLGGGIDEEVAKECCTILIQQLKQELPVESHTLTILESLQPGKVQERE